MSDNITTTLDLTETTYVPLGKLAKHLGLPAAYLKRLTDDVRLPYLEPLPHKRFYCLRDVEVALSKIAHAALPAGTPLDWTEFSARAAKTLKWLRVETWEQLRGLPKDKLLEAPNVGKGTKKEIERKLAAHDAQMTLWPELPVTANPPEAIAAPVVYDGDQA